MPVEFCFVKGQDDPVLLDLAGACATNNGGGAVVADESDGFIEVRRATSVVQRAPRK